jgi:phospholipid/cholesterol/gamma-HCH transport system substrate-binding protein
VNRRIAINLTFFGAIGLALAFWSVTNVISLDAVDRPYDVHASFETSPGLTQRFEVTYLGQRIGSIRSVDLKGDHVEVDMRLDRDIKVPAAVNAAVRRQSAVGEPYIDLSPTPGSDPKVGARLADGDVIPIERTTTPLAYSALFSAVDELLQAVDPKALSTLVHELARALDGRADSLREIVTSTGQIAGDLASNSELVDQVVGDLTTLTHTLAVHSASIATGTDDVAALAQTLAASQHDLDALLTDGPTFAVQLADVLAASADSLGCTLDGLGTVSTKLDPPTIAALSRLIRLSPQFAYVLRGLTAPPQGVGGELFLNNGSGPHPPLYPTPVSPPAVPTVPSCATTRPSAAPATGATAPTGGSDALPGVAAGAAAPTSPPVAQAPPAEASTRKGVGGSDLGLLPYVIVLLLLAAVVTVAWRRRAARLAPSAPADQDAARD